MGLDIYLKRYENFDDTMSRQKQYDDFTNKLWEEVGEYKELSQEQKDSIREKCREFAKTLNLDDLGSDEDGVTNIEEDHKDYPEHMFKIGYFRSSYNNSGIERILNHHELPTMSVIFNHTKDDYVFKPDWELSLLRCENTIKMFEEKQPVNAIPYYVDVFENDIENSQDAINLYLKELKKYDGNPSFGSYSSKQGNFYFDEPLTIRALIPGTNRYIVNKKPCLFAIIDFEKDWYINALKIIRDTIKFVLEQEDKEKYYLHWSG
jgi:hypothetical protein